MAATLHYGSNFTFNFGEESQVGYLRTLIARIVQTGKTEWIPLTGRSSDGTPSTTDILITPGVPLWITTDSDEGAAETMRSLIDDYINKWSADRAPNGE